MKETALALYYLLIEQSLRSGMLMVYSYRKWLYQFNSLAYFLVVSVSDGNWNLMRNAKSKLHLCRLKKLVQ